MFKGPQKTILVLFAAVLMTLLAGIFFRGMIKQDIRHYLENERQEVVRRGSENSGGPEVKSLRVEQEGLFIKGIDTVLLVWSLLMPGLALGLGILFLRKDGSTKKHVQAAVTVGTAVLNEGLETGGADSGEEIKRRPKGPALSRAAVTEEEQETVQDELLDASDEDMQPIPGDADRITKVVKGLDELAKAKILGRSLHKQPLELAKSLNTIIEKTRGSIQDKDVRFSLECGSDLTVSADPLCLTTIVSNLLENAAKAVKKDGSVDVSAAVEGEFIAVTVKDTGTGISRKALPHIFERFYRGSGNGIGMGLTIVKELVDACRGTIEVETARGKGSSFIVRIPRS